MLEELVAIHQQVMNTTPLSSERYLMNKINWDARSIWLMGGRGVGKTTLMCQFLLKKYKDASEGLYISADNINVLSYGLFNIAQEYFKYGGKALFIDEVHKYPSWQLEMKNIIDTYKTHQIIFSGSSSLDLRKSKSDLSRRVVYHELKGLSFREYLHLSEDINFPVVSLQEIMHHHLKLANQFKDFTILKYFKNYLIHGYFPFFLENRKDYLLKVSNIIEKIIFEDIAVIYNLRQPTLTVLKKILWLVATSHGLIPNIESMSKNIGVSREIIYQCIEYLHHSGLLNNLNPHAIGAKLIRKPGKIFLENTNLLYSINGGIQLESDIGCIRETFFVNQLSNVHPIHLHASGDFIIEKKYIFEVGGKSKDFRQIHGLEDAYLAIDGLEVGFGKKIPLYLFGFLY